MQAQPPRALRVDFDHHSPAHARDPWAVYSRLRADCPVAYTRAYGGFWILSRYEDVLRASIDTGTFSSARDDLLIPSRSSGRLLPVQCDPPAATFYRRFLMPYFSVAAARSLEPDIRGFVSQCIDRFAPSGTCDLVLDLANPVPAMTTLHLVGLSVEEWADFADPIHTYTYRRVDDPDGIEAAGRIGAIRTRIESEVDQRLVSGGNNLLSHLVTARLDGRSLSREEIVSIALMVIFGGIDTTTAAIGNALLYLHRNHAARDLLSRDPDRIPLAVEEFLRWEPPVQGFARTVNRDCDIGGQMVSAGQTAMLLWASANRDDAEFPEAAKVRLDRSPNRHLTFGAGPHRCIGATIARAELRIVLEEVLRRIPDYEVLEENLQTPQTVGIVFGRERMPARFTPIAGDQNAD